MTLQIKICGITNRDDACVVQKCGADYMGIIVDIAGSRRAVTAEAAAEISAGIEKIVLVMDGPVMEIARALRRVQPNAVQLIGHRPLSSLQKLKQASAGTQVWQTVHVPRNGDRTCHDLSQHISRLQQAGLDAIVLDTLVPGVKGGTGQTCDWDAAAALVRSSPLPVFLAGGLNHENVARAIAAVKPAGVDVSSGVEIGPGRKDPQKVSFFMQQARSASDVLNKTA